MMQKFMKRINMARGIECIHCSGSGQAPWGNCNSCKGTGRQGDK